MALSLQDEKLDKWVHERGSHIDFSRTGKTYGNGMVKSFNGRLLHMSWFIRRQRLFYGIVNPAADIVSLAPHN